MYFPVVFGHVNLQFLFNTAHFWVWKDLLMHFWRDGVVGVQPFSTKKTEQTFDPLDRKKGTEIRPKLNLWKGVPLWKKVWIFGLWLLIPFFYQSLVHVLQRRFQWWELSSTSFLFGELCRSFSGWRIQDYTIIPFRVTGSPCEQWL